MSGYTSGNNAPTQMAQAPNRKGNQSKHTATGTGGATGVTRPQGSTAYSKGHVGAPAAGGKVNGRGQKVQVSRPAANTGSNFGYMNESKPFLK
jgi:hypothetical protein